MARKIVSTIMLCLVLFSLFAIIFNFQSAKACENVAVGKDVEVQLSANVFLKFDEVTHGGSATETNPDPESVPVPLPGILGPYYNIVVTDVVFSGNVKVRITYDDSGLTECRETTTPIPL